MLNPPAGTPLGREAVVGRELVLAFIPTPCVAEGGLTIMLANWLLTCCLLSSVALSTTSDGEGGLAPTEGGARELEIRVGGEREEVGACVVEGAGVVGRVGGAWVCLGELTWRVAVGGGGRARLPRAV